MKLIDSLIKQGWLKTPRIIEAFKNIKRVDFLPNDIKNLDELNEALPIGFGQTISQPLVVAFMLELLQPQIGDKVLDVGSGSGWTTALLSEIVGEKGKVIAIETIPELKEFGENNVCKYNFIDKGIAEFICGDGSKGCPNISSHPELAEWFDKILCSAAIQGEIPPAWKKQIKEGGRIVVPIGSSIYYLIKRGKDFDKKEFPGFTFVPLV